MFNNSTTAKDNKLTIEECSNVYDFLEKNFPKSEIETKEQFINSYFSRNLLSVQEYDENKEIVGVLIGEVFQGTKILFLAYLAVDKRFRSRGLGEKLARKAYSEIIAEEGAVSSIILEIEVPDAESKVDENFGDPKKRLDFYKKFDCKQVSIGYFQPKMNVDDETNVPMLLLCRKLSGIIHEADLADWFKKYVANSADGFANPVMQNVLEALENPDLTLSDL